MERNKNSFEDAKIGRRSMIIIIVTATGPPIGGLLVLPYVFTLLLISSARNAWSAGFSIDPFQALSAIVAGVGIVFVVIVMSIVFGGIQALASGLLISVTSGPEGRFGYILAAVAPSIVGVIVMCALAWAYQMPLGLGSFLAAVGVVSSVIIRFLFRHRFGKA